MVEDYPDFCQGPDDLDVFAAVCLAVMHRYREVMGYQLSDVSVWNEPANEIEQSTSAFYCRDAARCTYHCGPRHNAVRPEPALANSLAFGISTASSIFTATSYTATTRLECRRTGVLGSLAHAPCGRPRSRADAAMYAAVYRAIKPAFGAEVRIAVSGGNSNFTRDVLTALRGESGVGVDMLDVHIYPDQPSAIPWRIYGRPDLSVESMLEETGWDRGTPIQLGEWSRSIGLNYAFDGPGAAFVACGLAHINALGATNSEHNVELSYLFAASKIWDGTRPESPDINAATVFNWWHQMSAPTGTGAAAGPPRMLATTGTDFTSQSARTTGAELTVVAADRTVDTGGGGEVLVLVSQYTKGPTDVTPPSTLACFDLAVTVSNVPWDRWTWTQYANEAGAALAAVAWGCGTGPNATLALQMHGNSYTGISVARAVPATPGAGIAVPAGAANPRFPADSPAYTDVQRAALARNGCPSRPASFASECPADVSAAPTDRPGTTPSATAGDCDFRTAFQNDLGPDPDGRSLLNQQGRAISVSSYAFRCFEDGFFGYTEAQVATALDTYLDGGEGFLAGLQRNTTDTVVVDCEPGGLGPARWGSLNASMQAAVAAGYRMRLRVARSRFPNANLVLCGNFDIILGFTKRAVTHMCSALYIL